MAIKLGWGGFATTDLNFSEFIGSDHTIAFRFMPQYPHSYAGAVLSSAGSPFYFVGQGQFNGDTRMPSFITQVDSERQDYPAELKPKTWHYVAVMQKSSQIRTYLDGKELSPRLNVPANLPTGKLILGRMDIWQVYGLIDDLVVFTRALSETEVKGLMTSPIPSTTASQLLAAWNFPTKQKMPMPPANFRRPVQLHGAAELVDTSANQSASQDSKLLGLPSLQIPPHLPFPTGEEWVVSHGFDERDGPSHWGAASFCLDLFRADGKTRDTPLYAAASGTVVKVIESSPSGPLPAGVSGNYVRVEHITGETSLYAHIIQNSAVVNEGDVVVIGQKIATAGDTGASDGGPGNDHLHFDISSLKGDSGNTIPSAFKDYEASTDGGKTWRYVSWGIPQAGERIRSLPKWSAWFGLGAPASGPIKGAPAVVAPMPGIEDIYVRGADDRLYQKWWTGSKWMPSDSGWALHDDGNFRLSSTPAVVSNGANFRDVYVRGQDGAVYHKFWDGKKWSQWFGLGMPSSGAIQGAPAAIMPTPDTIVIYVRGADNRLYQKWWTGSKWKPSDLGWELQDSKSDFKLGSSPAVIVNGTGFRDIYTRGQNGEVVHKFWNGSAWSKWFGLGGQIKEAPAVVLTPDGTPDIYVRGMNDRIFQKFWTGSDWMPSDLGWMNHEDQSFLLTSSPAVIAWPSNFRDVFVRGQNGSVFHKAFF